MSFCLKKNLSICYYVFKNLSFYVFLSKKGVAPSVTLS